MPSRQKVRIFNQTVNGTIWKVSIASEVEHANRPW